MTVKFVRYLANCLDFLLGCLEITLGARDHNYCLNLKNNFYTFISKH